MMAQEHAYSLAVEKNFVIVRYHYELSIYECYFVK
jgi:hypothetical protein